jgi:hypothetical protein
VVDPTASRGIKSVRQLVINAPIICKQRHAIGKHCRIRKQHHVWYVTASGIVSLLYLLLVNCVACYKSVTQLAITLVLVYSVTCYKSVALACFSSDVLSVSSLEYWVNVPNMIDEVTLLCWKSMMSNLNYYVIIHYKSNLGRQERNPEPNNKVTLFSSPNWPKPWSQSYDFRIYTSW